MSGESRGHGDHGAHTGVHGGHGSVEMIHESGEGEERRTLYGSVNLLSETGGTFEAIPFIYNFPPTHRAYCETRWVQGIGVS